ncbi:MAG TPA: VOC family protein [Calidithermus sp.]|nr:VOC family protein [Calidithermus sp.]
MLGRLAYVALVVSEVERVAAGLARDFGWQRADCAVGDGARKAPAFTVGRTGLVLFEPGDPFLGDDARPGLHHLGIEVADLAAAASRAAAVGVEIGTAAVPGLEGRRQLRLCPPTTLGVRVHLTERLAWPPAPPGWVERLDHIGVASDDNQAAVDLFSGRLGFPLESTQTDVEVRLAIETFTSDRYGVVHHARPVETAGGLRVAFVTVGDCELEFLQDLDRGRAAEAAGRGPGTTQGDRSAIARFVAARGPGLHHLALKVADLEAALLRLHRAGYPLIDTRGRPGSRRARIAFLDRRALGGVLVHLVEREASAG